MDKLHGISIKQLKKTPITPLLTQLFPLPSHPQLKISTPLAFPLSLYWSVLSHIHFPLFRFCGQFTSITTDNILNSRATPMCPRWEQLRHLPSLGLWPDYWTITKRSLKKLHSPALAGVVQWIEHTSLQTERSSVLLIPSQGTCLGYRPGPRLGCVWCNLSMFLLHIDVSIPLLLSPFPSKK